ncbi:MAG TPA: hypothetical protein VFU76_13910, partial [Terriglobales bacterium]|nr:hypothetical protein [Terriglobales bacterium]
TAMPEASGGDSNTRVAVARAIERFLSERTASPATTPAPPVAAPMGATQAAAQSPPPAKLKPRATDFVSVAEVRAALARKEKIVVGGKTIITPAARDLAAEYDVFAHEE